MSLLCCQLSSDIAYHLDKNQSSSKDLQIWTPMTFPRHLCGLTLAVLWLTIFWPHLLLFPLTRWAFSCLPEYPPESFSLPSSPKEFCFYITFSVRPPTFLIIPRPCSQYGTLPIRFMFDCFLQYFFHTIWHTVPLSYVYCLSPNSNVV